MKENDFRKHLTKRLQTAFGEKIYVQKNHGSVYSAGLPDLQLCLGGKWVSLELKVSPDNDDDVWRLALPQSRGATKLQANTLRVLHAAGAKAGLLCMFSNEDPAVCLWSANAVWEAHKEGKALRLEDAAMVSSWSKLKQVDRLLRLFEF